MIAKKETTNMLNETTTTTETTTENNNRRKVAIDAPRGTHFLVDPNELVIIGLDTKDGPNHPLYDVRITRPLAEDRIANFAFYGVLKPVLVRKDGDKLIVIDGRQRVRYARAANKELKKRGEEMIRVPVIVKKGDDAHLFGVSRAANLHDGDDLLTNARNAQRFIDMGRDLAEVATTFGVSASTVRNWIAMLDLAPEVQAQVVAGEIGTVAAVQLASLPAAEQVATVNEVKAEAKASGKRVTSDALAGKAREKAGKVANASTPKAKLGKIETILRKLAKQWTTESVKSEDLEACLDKISRIAAGMSLDKLCDEIAKESE